MLYFLNHLEHVINGDMHWVGADLVYITWYDSNGNAYSIETDELVTFDTPVIVVLNAEDKVVGVFMYDDIPALERWLHEHI
jgi:hypothetical protein